MSRERHADDELKATLKTELKNTTAERVLTLMADAMRELWNDDTEGFEGYWATGAARVRHLARDTENWG